MRRVNPQWSPHAQKTKFNAANASNTLGIYLEIRQINNTYEVHTWDGRIVGTFDNAKTAEIFARSYRTPIMPTQSIQDIRFIPDPKLAPPKPKKHEKVVMKPVHVADSSFEPIVEEDGVIVEHPEDIVIF